jgi:hypothetical protein
MDHRRGSAAVFLVLASLSKYDEAGSECAIMVKPRINWLPPE